MVLTSDVRNHIFFSKQSRHS